MAETDVSVEYWTTVVHFDQASDQAKQREQSYEPTGRERDVKGTFDYSADWLIQRHRLSTRKQFVP